MTERKAITQDYLRSILDYDPETGIFRHKARTDRLGRKNNRDAGKIAGSTNKPVGYIYICIDYQMWLSHRLAFIYVTGKCPKLVDHINGVRADNRWANLRPATIAQNTWNSKKRRDNTTGHRGVYWLPSIKLWRATIQANRRIYNLGYFRTKEAAIAAYRRKAKTVYGDFAVFDQTELLALDAN